MVAWERLSVKPTKIAVIGSNSFSGSHFVNHCLKQGLQVLGISRGAAPQDCFLPYRWEGGNASGFLFLQCDLNREMPRLLGHLRDFQPDYVVNFAAQGMVAPSWENPVDWYQTNTLSMVALHQGLREFQGLKAFVQASTPEVYGTTSGWVTEDQPFCPTTPYAISKAACDMNLLAFARTLGFPAVLTRAANVCGPGQQLYRILPRTIWAAHTGEKLTLEGGGLSERAFIHIEDVCAATLEAARQGQPGEIYHLSTSQTLTIRELVEMVCQKLGKPFHEVVDLGPARLGQDMAYRLDSAKARRTLNWEPAISLEQTISETIEWVEKFSAQLKSEPTRYLHRAS